ncbi:MAG: hypothetical protein WCV63_09350 [Negativicutes bacterium]|jgi:hypothetical protein
MLAIFKWAVIIGLVCFFGFILFHTIVTLWQIVLAGLLLYSIIAIWEVTKLSRRIRLLISFILVGISAGLLSWFFCHISDPVPIWSAFFWFAFFWFVFSIVAAIVLHLIPIGKRISVRKRNTYLIVSMLLAITLFVVVIVHSPGSENIVQKTETPNVVKEQKQEAEQAIVEQKRKDQINKENLEGQQYVDKVMKDAEELHAKVVKELVDGSIPLDYEHLMRYPEKCYGKVYEVHGKVLQLFEKEECFTVIVDNNPKQIVIIQRLAKKNDARILADDNLIIYGTFRELKPFKFVVGGERSIPLIRGQVIKNLSVN